jgi:broad specificity phosphatase PhoE
MTTRILLVRHGRTEWNKGEIFRGTVDIPLDDQGRREAACAREWLRSEKLDAAYASPLSRAMETARIILEPHGLSVTPHPGLTDLNYGDWQGVSLGEVRQKYPELYRMWKQTPHTVVFPNGEGLASVRDRALGAVQEIVTRHLGKTVLLAAHRVVNKVLVMALLGLDNSHFWRIGQDTAAVNEFALEDGVWICRKVNDTCHLRELEGRVTHDF